MARPVLIVEHSPAVRAQMAARLRDAKLNCYGCVNVQDAVHTLSKRGIPKAFLISTRIGTDASAGVGLARALGRVGRLRSRPMVLLVGHEAGADAELPPHVRTIAADGPLRDLVAAINTEPEVHPEADDGTGLPSELQRSAASLEAALKLFRSVLLRVKSNRLPGPVMPELVAKVRELCSNDNLQPKRLAEFLDRHQALSLRFLALANSAYYARGATIKSVAKAVARVGFTPALTLLQAIAAREYIVGKDKRLRASIGRGLERAYLVSTVAKMLARLSKEIDPDEAGLVGLFHNIGPTFLLYTFALLAEKEDAKIDYDAAETAATCRASELNEAVVGAMRLPKEINLVFAAGPEKTPASVTTVRRAMWIADAILDEDKTELDFGPRAKLLGFNEMTVDALNSQLPAFAALLAEYRKA